MTKRWRIGIALAGLSSIGLTALAAVRPEAAVCLSIGLRDLDRLADGTLVERQLNEAQRREVLALQEQARGRIAGLLGASAAQASPVVVFLEDPAALWPARYNRYASANFIGTRACVVVGPEGRNLDVVSHELMHAELFERVGPWQRAFSVPTWFDEGLAMQLDYREKYSLPEPGVPTSSVRSLASAAEFFVNSDPELTRHYAFAKAEIGKWLARVGPTGLGGRLDRIKSGEDFDRVWRD